MKSQLEHAATPPLVLAGETRARALRIAFVALCMWLAAAASFQTDAGAGFEKLIWLPSGVGAAALLAWGWGMWPGLVLGTLALGPTHGLALVPLAALALAAGLEATALRALIGRFTIDPACLRLRDVLALTAVTLAAALPAAGVEFLQPRVDVMPTGAAVWWSCYIGRALGLLLVVPLVLGGSGLASGRPLWRLAECALLFVVTLGLSLAVFAAMGDPDMFNPLPYALFPLLFWGALRFGPREVAGLLLVVGYLASWGTAAGDGPFALAARETALGALYLYLTIVTIVALALAALIAERQRAEAEGRQHMQQLAQVSRALALGEMGSAIAHELNQPLAAIASYSQACARLLAAGESGEEVQRAMTRIGAQAERAGEILRRLRGFIAQRDTASMAHDPSALLAEAIELARSEAAQRGVALRLASVAAMPVVQVDGVQIQQVVLNLLRNAIEAVAGLDDGARWVEVTSGVTEGGIIITVRDGGPGVAPAIAGRVFEPFFTTKAAGTGIGLAISRSIAEAHGGHLRLVPGEGGACFRLWLPCGVTENQAGTTRHAG